MAKGESEENVRDISAKEGADKLVSRSAADSAAFALLYDIYYEKIFSYCVGRVRVRQIAEDLTSTTFLSAAQNISGFQGKTRTEFADWLYAIATKKINTQLGKKQTVKKLITAEIQDLRSDTITWPMLHNAILKLAPKEQTIIALRFFEGLTAARIAEITGSRPDAVRLRIARALENIKMFGSTGLAEVNTGKQFEDTVKKLDIDNIPDSAHKERLRAKILSAFNSASRKKHRALLYSLAAAIVLITAGLALWFYSGAKTPLPLRHTAKPPKPAAEANLPLPQEERTRLEKIRLLAAEKDIPGLLEILKGSDPTAKLLAAKFLAELTDSNAADIIKLAAPPEKTGTSKETAAQQKDKQQKTLLIKTTEKKTNLPLADVALQIRFADRKDLIEAPTDNNGQYLLVVPGESFNRFQIKASREGYATMRIIRQSSGQSALLFMPDVISFEMSGAIEISGIVKNEQLEPIEGAEIRVYVDFSYNPEMPLVDTGGEFKTDANGVWKCSSFPEDSCQASIMITHPDYVSQDTYRPAIVEQLKDFSYVTVLEKGVTVTGRVLDLQQKPLQATVGKGPDRRGNPATCDPNGWFRFENVAPIAEVFTAQCAGAAPQMQQVDIGPNMPPIVFSLEPAKTIRGRIVDINDTPVENVYVRVSSWHGFALLNFETRTDANGFFRWNDAPDDEVLFNLSKPGYMSASNFAMTSQNDYVITLQPAFKISGTVTSSDPCRPVGIFKITQGYYRDSSAQISWQDYNASTFSDNRYELIITEPFEIRLKAQAKGFMPAESPTLGPEQGTVTYDFVLEPIKAAP